MRRIFHLAELGQYVIRVQQVDRDIPYVSATLGFSPGQTVHSRGWERRVFLHDGGAGHPLSTRSSAVLLVCMRWSWNSSSSE